MSKPLWVFTLLCLTPSLSLAESLYLSPEVRENKALYDTLIYNVIVDHESGSTIDWTNTKVIRNGTPMRLYFQSSEYAPSYGFCYKFSYRNINGDERTRHDCHRWRDTKFHSVEIMSPAEAQRLAWFQLHTYDVRGTGSDWDGIGNPPGMLSHDSKRISFTDATVLSYSAEMLRSVVSTTAHGVLLCAHPTATYQGVGVDDVSFTAETAAIDFTIGYRCNGPLERQCSMSLRASFTRDGFRGLKVTTDTAFTDATIGLDACESIIRKAFEAIRR